MYVFLKKKFSKIKLLTHNFKFKKTFLESLLAKGLFTKYRHKAEFMHKNDHISCNPTLLPLLLFLNFNFQSSGQCMQQWGRIALVKRVT